MGLQGPTRVAKTLNRSEDMNNEGRADLQRVILQYEKQRAEAIRSKQEAEIVLPFVRAALEELDAALGQSENNSEGQREQTKRAVERSAAAAKERATDPAPAVEEPKAPVAAKSVFGVSEEDEFEMDETPAKESPFGRSSIASLIDEAGKKHKTG